MEHMRMDIKQEYCKGGCILKATKIINKTAAKLDRLVQKSTTITVWSIINRSNALLAIVIMLLQIMPLTTVVSAAPAPAPVPVPQPHQNQYSNMQLARFANAAGNSLVYKKNSLESLAAEALSKKKKHRIRSTESQDMLWHNPCGGKFNGDKMQKHKKITIETRKEAYNVLRKAINWADLYKNEPGTIPINDLQEWDAFYGERYKFLAVIKPKSNITLVRWHQQMQRYIGVISYLRRHHGIRNNKDIAVQLPDLNALNNASRRILCAIETAINATQFQPKIRFYTKPEMNKYIVGLQTKDDRVHEVDLSYVKSKYINTTKGMVKALGRKIREMKCIIKERKHSSRNSSSGDSEANASRSVSWSSSSSRQYHHSGNQLDDNTSHGSISWNSNSISREHDKFKRSRICQRVLEEKKYNRRVNRNRKAAGA